MQIKELMRTRRIVSARTDDDLGLAVQIMRWAGVRHLPVVADDRRIAGILTEHDLLRVHADDDARAASRSVGEVMSRPPEVIRADEEVAAACALMVARKIGCLPVVDESGALVGIVTKSDLIGRQLRTELASASAGSARAATAMRADPPSVRPYEPLLEAVALMVEREARHVAVTDEQNHVVGILSDGDVRTAIGDPVEALHQELTELEEMKVSGVMTTDVITVPRDARLDDVARLFVDRNIGAVPVVDQQQRLVGMVSYVDVLRALFPRGVS